ncbi:MAG: hypothetical protein M1814_001697 [Vezdaea aestivalis]|nr:MAG: hypothetical protein M1814_001697 [Vezdaea aestivalis]
MAHFLDIPGDANNWTSTPYAQDDPRIFNNYPSLESSTNPYMIDQSSMVPNNTSYGITTPYDPSYSVPLPTEYNPSPQLSVSSSGNYHVLPSHSHMPAPQSGYNQAPTSSLQATNDSSARSLASTMGINPSSLPSHTRRARLLNMTLSQRRNWVQTASEEDLRDCGLAPDDCLLRRLKELHLIDSSDLVTQQKVAFTITDAHHNFALGVNTSLPPIGPGTQASTGNAPATTAASPQPAPQRSGVLRPKADKRSPTKPGERVACPQCKKTFSSPKHLERHMVNHSTGEKPYGCLVCGTRFHRSDVLKRHHTQCAEKHGDTSGRDHLEGVRGKQKTRTDKSLTEVIQVDHGYNGHV